jgi:hypothetical protein
LNTLGEFVKTTTFLIISLALTAVAAASPNGGPLGDFEAHGDIGSPKIAGYATYNAASQVYTLSAGGVNVWAKRDEFRHRPASQGRHHGAQHAGLRRHLCRRRAAR